MGVRNKLDGVFKSCQEVTSTVREIQSAARGLLEEKEVAKFIERQILL